MWDSAASPFSSGWVFNSPWKVRLRTEWRITVALLRTVGNECGNGRKDFRVRLPPNSLVWKTTQNKFFSISKITSFNDQHAVFAFVAVWLVDLNKFESYFSKRTFNSFHQNPSETTELQVYKWNIDLDISEVRFPPQLVGWRVSKWSITILLVHDMFQFFSGPFTCSVPPYNISKAFDRRYAVEAQWCPVFCWREENDDFEECDLQSKVIF